MLTEYQLKRHNECITATKAVAIIGLSPYRSKYSIFAEMKGKLPAADFDEARLQRMKAGIYMERGIADYALHEWGWDLRPGPTEGKEHPKHDFLYGLIDRLKYEDGKPSHVVEIKNVDKHRKNSWELGPPDGVRAQTFFYMMLYDLPGYVVVCFGGNEFENYLIRRERIIEDFLLQESLGFWDDLRNNRWPPPDNTPSTTETLKRLFPRSFPRTVRGDKEAMKWALKREVWKREEDLARKKKELFENKIKDFMGENERIRFDDGSEVTWKSTKDVNYFNLPVFRNEMPEECQKYTIMRPGHRMLRVKIR